MFTFDNSGQFRDRIEAKVAFLEQGYWRFEDAHIYSSGNPAIVRDNYRIGTNLTLAQVRESFATPETVPFWKLPFYIDLAENAPDWALPVIGCSTSNCCRVRSCSPRWSCSPLRSACASFVSAACKRWCWAEFPPAFCCSYCQSSRRT